MPLVRRTVGGPSAEGTELFGKSGPICLQKDSSAGPVDHGWRTEPGGREDSQGQRDDNGASTTSR